MKRQILLAVVAAFAFASNAQDFDSDPTVKIDNNDAHFTIGARMMADAAYYHSDYTPVKSGASLVDARIRTSMSYQDWYFYADFDFSGGKFSQKNIFLQYSKEDQHEGKHTIKAGYYNDPATMARNTSLGSYHFISRPAPSYALQEGRELGITYKYRNKKVFANQGVFAENKYNDQEDGYQGVTVSGRWLYYFTNNENETFHVGVSGRYGHIGTGTVYNNTLKRNLTLSTALETYVDANDEFLCADMPWASNTYNVGVEALYRNKKFFARGEYMFKYVTKSRDDQTLFEQNLGSIDSWGSLASWRAGNPLGDNKFSGAYIEAGAILSGGSYSYNHDDAILGGLAPKTLELVARYSYTGLNDIVDGEYYYQGRDQYYPNGNIADWPSTSKSIGGGRLHAITLGANYAVNKYVQLMLSYTYSNLQRDKYPEDKNFHEAQARVQFSF